MNYFEKTDQDERSHETRFLRNDKWTKKKYLTEFEEKEAYNMINANDNYKNSGNNTKYKFCESDDNTEHWFECPIHQRLTKEEMKAIDLESVDNM